MPGSGCRDRTDTARAGAPVIGWGSGSCFTRGESDINSWYHAKSSAKKWGGTEDAYIRVHEFIDSSKKIIGDSRHRSIYHHTEGTWLCQQIFGRTIEVGRIHVPVREIAERHIIEDLGWLPSPADYIKNMALDPWMSGSVRKSVPLSHLLSGKSLKEAV